MHIYVGVLVGSIYGHESGMQPVKIDTNSHSAKRVN